MGSRTAERASIVEKMAFVEARDICGKRTMVEVMGETTASGIRVRLYEAPGAALLVTRWSKSEEERSQDKPMGFGARSKCSRKTTMLQQIRLPLAGVRSQQS